MKTITATFRVVTPLFMSGAQQTKAELRLAGIKGALRFWWRALAWAKYQNIAELKHREAKLFGSADDAIGQSKILMKLELPEHDASYVQQQQANDWGINQWESYVGFGLVDRKLRPTREYITGKNNKPFTFKLICLAKHCDTLQEIMPAIQLLGLLGNLGGRSRKGWGSISLEQCHFSESCAKEQGGTAWSAPQNAEDYRQQLETLLEPSRKFAGLPPYTAFSRESCIEIGKSYSDAKGAQRYLAHIYKTTLTSGRDKSHRQQFGLPRTPLNDRRASPVFLHVHQLPNQQALPVIAFLPAQFLSHRDYAPGNNVLIHDLLDTLKESQSQPRGRRL